MSKVLMVAGTEPVHEVVEGRLYTLQPNEPLEIEKDIIARAIIEMKGESYGIIEVPVIREKTGVRYDLETAGELAEAALLKAEEMLINQYIQHQLDDRIRQNFAALPPSPRVARLIEKHKVDLTAYGIRPVGIGFAKNEAPAPTAEVALLRETNEEQARQILAMQKQMKEILDRLSERTGAGQPAPAEPKTTNDGPDEGAKSPEPTPVHARRRN